MSCCISTFSASERVGWLLIFCSSTRNWLRMPTTLWKKTSSGISLACSAGSRRVEDSFSLVPAGCELLHDGIGLLDAQPIHNALDDGFHKLPERHVQVGCRDMRFGRGDLAGIGVQRSRGIVKPDIGEVLGDALDDAHPVMGMLDSLAYGKVLNFHIRKALLF